MTRHNGPGWEIVEKLFKHSVMRAMFFFCLAYIHLIGVVASRQSGLDGGLGAMMGFVAMWFFFELLTRWRPAWKPELPKALWFAAFFVGFAAAGSELFYVTANHIMFWEGVAASAVFAAGFSCVLIAQMKGMDALFSRS